MSTREGSRAPRFNCGALPHRIHLAVVHGAGRIRVLAAAASRPELLSRLCTVLLDEAKTELWEEDYLWFRELTSSGRLEEAIDLYSSRVGDRWDEAKVDIHVLESGQVG